jgi:Leucine Rich repeat
MLLRNFSRNRLFSTTKPSLPKAPEELAEHIIEDLKHKLDIHQLVNSDSSESSASFAAQYDLTGQVEKTSSRWFNVLGKKKIEQFFPDHSYSAATAVGVFHLDDKSLDAFDAYIISRIIRFHNQKVSLLNLNKNPQISDLGASSLSETLPFLKSLFLSSTTISNEGVDHLCSALSSSKTLSILELRNNPDITCTGARAIAESVLKNPYLTEGSIFLSNTNIGDEGAVELAKAAIDKQHVKFWLYGCEKISEEIKIEIKKYTKNLRF